MTGFNSLLKNKTKANVLMLAIALIAIVIIMSIATDRFYQPTNVMNILTQITSLGICAAGAGIVMILGGIDLTTGNILAFTACATAALMNAGFSTGVAVLIGIILAIGCGMLNGTLIVLSRAEPFIITLGMMTVYKDLLCLLLAERISLLLGILHSHRIKHSMLFLFLSFAWLRFLYAFSLFLNILHSEEGCMQLETMKKLLSYRVSK